MAHEPHTTGDQRQYAFGLTGGEVERFREIMRRESGIALSPEEAWARAVELLAVFRMLLGPLPEDRPVSEFEHRRS